MDSTLACVTCMYYSHVLYHLQVAAHEKAHAYTYYTTLPSIFNSYHICMEEILTNA